MRVEGKGNSEDTQAKRTTKSEGERRGIRGKGEARCC